eukprot:TRINITY_DN7413_c0_g1_i1.p1 TRINITY_DN7413_c0_g1~~TRINITY_DN7413_c0_g1_i1.p1  ORF type:complete len:280 (+),score=116.27 TRINITY_DN7413_c0_g1_i1:25-840(+)
MICKVFEISRMNLDWIVSKYKEQKQEGGGKEEEGVHRNVSILVPVSLETINVVCGKEEIEKGVAIDQAFRRLFPGAEYIRVTESGRREEYEVNHWNKDLYQCVVVQKHIGRTKTSNPSFGIKPGKKYPEMYKTTKFVKSDKNKMGGAAVVEKWNKDKIGVKFGWAQVKVRLVGWKAVNSRAGGGKKEEKEVYKTPLEYSFECLAVRIRIGGGVGTSVNIAPKPLHSFLHVIMRGMSVMWDKGDLEESCMEVRRKKGEGNGVDDDGYGLEAW